MTDPKESCIFSFAGFTLDEAARGICGPDGVISQLNGKNLDVLIFLIRNRDRLIPNHEIFEAVWKVSWDASYQNSIDRAISDIRKLLNDSPQDPTIILREKRRGIRFIAPLTVRTMSGTPFHRVLRSRVGRGAFVIGGAAALVGLVTSRQYWASRTGIIEVRGIRPVTNTPTSKRIPIVSDGTWVYFTEEESGEYRITKARITDGSLARFATAIPNPYVCAVSPSRLELLVRQIVGDFDNDECPLWLQPLDGRPPNSLERHGIRGFDGVWTPSGDALLVCHGPEIVHFNLSTKHKQVLAKVNGFAWWPRWSPDGRLLRFTLQSSAGDDSLWEMEANGRSLKPVFSSSVHPWTHGGCGTWSPDGSYFVFDAPTNDSESPRDRALWVWRNGDSSPHILTSQIGRMRGPSFPSGGNQLWFRAESLGAEPFALDLTSGGQNWLPLLDQFETASFARDGAWIAYTSPAPEDELLISRVDSTQRRHLLGKPRQCAFPEWSPDGERIAVIARLLGRPWQIVIIHVNDGRMEWMPETLGNTFHPTWLPDSNRLVFSTIPALDIATESQRLFLLDVATKKVQPLAGTENVYRPMVSPDGQWISCLSFPQNSLKLYHLETGRMQTLRNPNTSAPTWQKDSNSLLFLGHASDGTLWVNSVNISDAAERALAKVPAGIKVFDRWMGLSPSGQAILVRSLDRQQLFAINIG